MGWHRRPRRVAGIGFTVSIFVAGLAFPGDVAAQGEAKIGILVASTTLLGIAILTQHDSSGASTGTLPRRDDRRLARLARAGASR